MKPQLCLGLLFAAVFTLATVLAPRFDAAVRAPHRGGLGAFLGESKKLFANRFFVKADEKLEIPGRVNVTADITEAARKASANDSVIKSIDEFVARLPARR
jgi:hypothetical protein